MKDIVELIVGGIIAFFLTAVGVVGALVLLAGVMLALFSPFILMVWLIANLIRG